MKLGVVLPTYGGAAAALRQGGDSGEGERGLSEGERGLEEGAAYTLRQGDWAYDVPPPGQGAASPESIVRTAQLAEELGYDSIWAIDHVVAPPTVADRHGAEFYDPLTILAHVASCTHRVRLGTTVIILPYRNPLVLAKSLATIDQLSGGRLTFGMAAGWSREEFDALGVPFEARGARTDEYLQIIKACWTQERPAFQGRFFSFSDIQFLPKPVQKPHPPIWVGGTANAALRRAVEHGDAWHPSYLTHEQYSERAAAMTAVAQERGVPVPQMTLRLGGGIRITEKPIADPNRRPGTGTLNQIRDDLLRFRELGVKCIVVDFPVGDAQELYQSVERLGREVLPSLA